MSIDDAALNQPVPMARQIWSVGALCRAVADALQARFGAVAVRGEISGFSRAASGHCYFQLKDETGQIRCAIFRRHALMLNWQPADGDQVELYGRLALYEARGDLQLVVEHMRRCGAGALYEDYLRRKEALAAQGLFDAQRKRTPTPWPRGIGLVTSPAAAALHDVVTALQRRAPHVPVLLVPALVQGQTAAASLVAALQRLYALVKAQQAADAMSLSSVDDVEQLPADSDLLPHIDTIVLVRGGGSIEDLWPFNNTDLAHTIVQSPVPLICGVGHETDFTIADFCADVRAPTPTAAAELAAMPAQEAWQHAMQSMQALKQRIQQQLDGHAQRLDGYAWALLRGQARIQTWQQHVQRLGWRLQQHSQRHVTAQQVQLNTMQLRMQSALQTQVHAQLASLTHWHQRLQYATRQAVNIQQQRLSQTQHKLHLLNPQHVLARGYALLQDEQGRTLHQRNSFHPHQTVTAHISDGTVALRTAWPADGTPAVLRARPTARKRKPAADADSHLAGQTVPLFPHMDDG